MTDYTDQARQFWHMVNDSGSYSPDEIIRRIAQALQQAVQAERERIMLMVSAGLNAEGDLSLDANLGENTRQTHSHCAYILCQLFEAIRAQAPEPGPALSLTGDSPHLSLQGDNPAPSPEPGTPVPYQPVTAADARFLRSFKLKEPSPQSAAPAEPVSEGVNAPDTESRIKPALCADAYSPEYARGLMAAAEVCEREALAFRQQRSISDAVAVAMVRLRILSLLPQSPGGSDRGR